MVGLIQEKIGIYKMMLLTEISNILTTCAIIFFGSNIFGFTLFFALQRFAGCKTLIKRLHVYIKLYNNC